MLVICLSEEMLIRGIPGFSAFPADSDGCMYKVPLLYIEIMRATGWLSNPNKITYYLTFFFESE
jgi:hypothetical protein